MKAAAAKAAEATTARALDCYFYSLPFGRQALQQLPQQAAANSGQLAPASRAARPPRCHSRVGSPPPRRASLAHRLITRRLSRARLVPLLSCGRSAACEICLQRRRRPLEHRRRVGRTRRIRRRPPGRRAARARNPDLMVGQHWDLRQLPASCDSSCLFDIVDA